MSVDSIADPNIPLVPTVSWRVNAKGYTFSKLGLIMCVPIWSLDRSDDEIEKVSSNNFYVQIL